MDRIKCNYVNKYLSSAFRLLGQKVARHPFLFFSLPLLIDAILAVGFIRIKFIDDVEYLYCPINGRARKEIKAVESLFPSNHVDVDFLRETRMTRLSGIIIEPADRGSVFRENIMEFVREVDEAAKNFSIPWKNRTIRYRDICPKTTSGECFVNEILSLRGKTRYVKGKRLRIRYPMDSHLLTDYRISVANLGGVTLDENGYVEDAKAIRLLYLLEYATPEMDEMSVLWEAMLVKVLRKLPSDKAYAYPFVGSMFNSEFHRVTEMVLPLVFIACPLILGFSVITCLTRDWVTSKPWIGVAGCVTSCLGVFGAFGLLLLCGAEYEDVNIALPFLMTGVGLDDSFVVLAAWRRTNPKDPVEKRLADSYSEAAVSVTITSLTNFLSFCIGMTTPYNVIRIFSLYAAISVVSCYVFQLTFFGASLALAGLRESSGRHSILCIKVKPEREQKNAILKFIYFGLPARQDTDLKRPSFYRDTLGRILIKPYVKAVIFVTFIIYLGGSIFCLKYLKQGFQYKNGFPYDSYAINATLKHYEYFTEYPHPISVVVNATLDYSRPQVQRDIEHIILKFTSAPNMAGDAVLDSWLNTFLETVNDRRFWFLYRGYNISDSQDFIQALQNVFLRITSFRRFKQDILFNKNKTEIMATRFIISSKNILDSEMERKLILMLWDLADSSKYQVYVHNFWFIIYNQHTDIMGTSIQALCTAAILITVVFVIFIPNVACVVCVAATIVSVQTGVIGYMSLWGVSLDTISTVNLLMAAGFSVDYAAHISYAYTTSKKKHPNERLKDSLEAAGHPIVQGCVSTVLGVSALWFGPSYVFVTFFKILFLVMIFSGAHGLFLLPVCLSIWDSLSILLINRGDYDVKEINQATGVKEVQALINTPYTNSNQGNCL